MIYIASDHAGFSIKDKVISHLKELGLEAEDLGPDTDDRVDYPDFANKVCEEIKDKQRDWGLLICGSGQGMAMRANKFPWVRAALCWNEESAILSRQHNNANVLCLGARLLEETTILNILNVFFKEEFQGGRHQGRVEKIQQPIP